MNYKKAIELLEELRKLYPTHVEELNLAIKTMRNVEKGMGYSNVFDNENVIANL